MNNRYSRPNGPRGSIAPIHRGPQASAPGAAATLAASYSHSPNAALLIDFDNVTMGIRSDLQTELKNLLSSDIIRGKVQLQRAYADWRRYPQYVVPLAESSIDMIMAPAYGSSKKNATDIRLAVDAIELVFTRPEIGTFILLSGDSDFSTLVIKLKEYGKYVIGVGIRESSSDLLVMNCDEYYSYNALAGLVNSKDEEGAPRHDPWELVTLAISRMKKNGDVMRSDRLKQVMQEIDSSFDEKNLGMSKFSRFCQEAAGKGLLLVTKLENGQLEVAPPDGASLAAADDRMIASRPPREAGGREGRDRGRGRGRGRGGRDREERIPGQAGSDVSLPRVLGAASENGSSPSEMLVEQDGGSLDGAPDGVSVNGLAMDGQPNDGPMSDAEIVESGIAQQRPDRPSRGDRHRGRGDRGPRPERTAAPAPRREDIGSSGERFTRDEAFDLVRRAVASVVSGDESTTAERVRVAAFTLLGHDSESLSERNFARILRDAHDGDVIDLRRRGDDYEVAIAAQAAPVAEQLNQAAAANAPVAAPSGPAAPRGMGPRSAPGRGGRGGFGRGGAGGPPPELLMVGVVDHGEPAADAVAEPESTTPHAASRTASNSESDESAASDASQVIARANAEAEANEEAADAGQPDEGGEADESGTTPAAKRPAARGARGARGRGAVAKKTAAKKVAAPVDADDAEPKAAAASKSAAAKKPRRPRARSKTAAAKKA